MKPIEKVSVDVIQGAKTYADGTRGLYPTNLHIAPGEVLALLGPSGCGKTTLLRMIAGLESADPGSQIFFGKQDVTHKPVQERQVGMVFQNYALFPQMTVQANIAYGLRVRGLDQSLIRQRVGELIDLVRLQGMEHKRPAELSGGQKQRVALARAVAVQPRVLLLDEPLAALDAKLKESLRTELAQMLRQLGVSAVHVTHDQQEAMAVADRLAVMQAGRIVQVGTGEALYRAPKHIFVAQFLGKINRIQRLAEDLPSPYITLGPQRLPCPQNLQAQQQLWVRPEDIQVTEARDGLPQAQVIRRQFLGERVHLYLDIAGQDTLMAEIPQHAAWQEGQLVGLHISPDRFLHVEAAHA